MLSILISFVFGILLSLAYPRADVHWLAWFAPAPLMYFTQTAPWKRSALCGLAFGTGFFGAVLYWIAIFGYLPWAALALYQGLFIAGFAAVSTIMGPRLGAGGRFLLLPSLWVLFEWLRSLGPLGFTWGALGYSQYRVLPLIQISSILGVWGVSFLLAMFSAGLAGLAAARRTRRDSTPARGYMLVSAVLVLQVFLLGMYALPHDCGHGKPVRAAVIQGNLNPDTFGDAAYTRRAWAVYTRLTHQAAKSGADLIVWGEGAVPGPAGLDIAIRERLAGMAAASNADMLVGCRDQDKQGNMYNSVFLVSPRSGLVGRYAKVHLVPFGEYVPLRERLPFLLPLLRRYQVTPYDQSPGRGYNLTDTGKYKLGTSICFESIFPGISRRMAAKGANILCVVTNDSWFLRTAAAEQHMAMSVFRAVENRRYLVRTAATGVSCIISPLGEILTRSNLFEEAVLTADVYALSAISAYTRYGDWFIYMLVGVVVLLHWRGRLRARRMAKAQTDVGSDS